MSIVTLPSFVDGVVVHAADLNALSSNIDTLSQITAGKPASAGASSKPLCKVTRTSLAVPNNTVTSLVWAAAPANTDGMWSSGAVITINTDGWYRVTLAVPWAGGIAPGTYSLLIFVNGTANPANLAAQKDEYPGATASLRQQAHLHDRFTAGTTLQARVIQTSGASQSVDASFGGPWMTVAWDAPY